jgi:hypothetical protein
MMKLLAICFVLFILTGCSINHPVADDYSQYLVNNKGGFQLPETDYTAEYRIAPETLNQRYEFRAATTGYANLWVVEFGKILEDTLQSSDVQAAFKSLTETSESTPDGIMLLEFKLVDYKFEGFEARVKLNVRTTLNGKTVMDNTYYKTGISQGGKMFWAGAFGMKNAIQQSTKNAIDQILYLALTDIKASW